MERGTEEKASGKKEEMRGEGRGRREEGERGDGKRQSTFGRGLMLLK